MNILLVFLECMNIVYIFNLLDMWMICECTSIVMYMDLFHWST